MDFTNIENEKTATIKIIGVGGAGGNAINKMIAANLQGVEFIVADMDAEALATSRAAVKLQIGSSSTERRGSDTNPLVGRDAALESEAEIRDALKDSEMIFIIAGLGGVTGTGAAPVVARIAKETGALTVPVASSPFSFEDKKRLDHASAGLEDLKQMADVVITIPNDRICDMVKQGTPMVDMLKKADESIYHSVKGITDLMVPGLVCLDFADLRTLMEKPGMEHMGIGIGMASGENRAVKAVDQVITHILPSNIDFSSVKGLIMNVTSTNEITMDEITDAMDRLYDKVSDDAEIVWGHIIDETLGDALRITVIATGIGGKKKIRRVFIKL